MIGLRAAHHEPTYHLPQGDIHILADEDDAVEVVRHQLAREELDIAGAGGTQAQRTLRRYATLDSRDVVPTAQHGLAERAGAHIGALGAIATELAEQWSAAIGAKGDEVYPPAFIVDELAPLVGERQRS